MGPSSVPGNRDAPGKGNPEPCKRCAASVQTVRLLEEQPLFLLHHPLIGKGEGECRKMINGRAGEWGPGVCSGLQNLNKTFNKLPITFQLPSISIRAGAREAGNENKIQFPNAVFRVHGRWHTIPRAITGIAASCWTPLGPREVLRSLSESSGMSGMVRQREKEKEVQPFAPPAKTTTTTTATLRPHPPGLRLLFSSFQSSTPAPKAGDQGNPPHAAFVLLNLL